MQGEASEDGSSAAPFFIVGCGRSGTTLLRVMLDAHDDLAIPVESLFLADYLRAPPSVSQDDFRRNLLREFELEEWRIDVSLDDFEGCETPQAHIERLHELYAAAHGKSVWGQKTPRLVRHGERLAELFPDARFIHVVRDPRAVVPSLIKSNAHRSNALYAARRWHRDVEAGLALEAAMPERVLRVTYEELVGDSRATLGRICEFIGVNEPEDPDAYTSAARPEYGEYYARIHARLKRPPDPSRINAWRETSPQWRLRLIEWECGETMRAAGYELVTDAAKPSALRLAGLWAERKAGLVRQMLHYVLTERRRYLIAYLRRKQRLGLFFRDLGEVNY